MQRPTKSIAINRATASAFEVRISAKLYANQGKRLPSRDRRWTEVFRTRTRSAKSGGPERIGLRRSIFGVFRAGRVNSSTPKSPGNLPLSAVGGQAETTLRRGTGGESGIRTHGTLARTHAFQACALSHSAISPSDPLPKRGTGRGQASCDASPRRAGQAILALRFSSSLARKACVVRYF